MNARLDATNDVMTDPYQVHAVKPKVTKHQGDPSTGSAFLADRQTTKSHVFLPAALPDEALQEASSGSQPPYRRALSTLRGSCSSNAGKSAFQSQDAYYEASLMEPK